jgi:hypothetical protein
MKVQRIDWISHEAKEADVEVSDGIITCQTFCQPCNYIVGDLISEPLHPFSVSDARLSLEPEQGIWPIEGDSSGLKRRFVAIVVSTLW